MMQAGWGERGVDWHTLKGGGGERERAGAPVCVRARLLSLVLEYKLNETCGCFPV